MKNLDKNDNHKEFIDNLKHQERFTSDYLYIKLGPYNKYYKENINTGKIFYLYIIDLADRDFSNEHYMKRYIIQEGGDIFDLGFDSKGKINSIFKLNSKKIIK